MPLLTQSALLQALGWSLFNSLWQMGLLWLLYLLLIIVCGRMTAAVRHTLVLALLGVGTGWSIFSFVSTYYTLLDGGAGGGWLLVLSPVRTLLAAIIPYGSSLYLLVLGGLLVRYSYHYFHSTRLTRSGLSRIAPEFRVFVETTSRRMGIRPAVKVWLSTLVDVPVTFGFLKPVILVPLAMVSQLSTEQVEAILVHELAHIRRKDFLLNLVLTVLEGLFFFNPFTRWMIGDLKKEREHSCDDLVLQFRYDPHAYVSALLLVATRAAQEPATRLVVAATGSGNDQLLLQRAQRMLQQQRKGDRPGAKPLALLLLTLLISVLTVSRPGYSEGAAEGTGGTAEITLRTAAGTENGAPLISNSGRGPLVRPTPPPAGLTPPRQPAHPPMAETRGRQQVRPIRPGHSGERSGSGGHSAGGARPGSHPGDHPGSIPEDPALLAFVNAIAPENQLPPEELVIVTRKDNREYSIGKSPAVSRTPKGEGQPFVPKSSFSFQSIEEDTLHPEEKLARLQQETQREIALNMQKLQLDLMAQLELVKARQAALEAYNIPDGKQVLQEQRALLEQQLQLQKAYIQKLDQLQKRLKKVQQRVRIVYI